MIDVILFLVILVSSFSQLYILSNRVSGALSVSIQGLLISSISVMVTSQLFTSVYDNFYTASIVLLEDFHILFVIIFQYSVFLLYLAKIVKWTNEQVQIYGIRKRSTIMVSILLVLLLSFVWMFIIRYPWTLHPPSLPPSVNVREYQILSKLLLVIYPGIASLALTWYFAISVYSYYYSVNFGSSRND